MKTSLLTIFFIFIFTLMDGQIFFPSKPGLTVIPSNGKPNKIEKPVTDLHWSPTPLIWTNYTKIRDTTVIKKVGRITIKAKAATTTAISADFQCTGNEFYYDVQSIFSIKRSWYMKDIKNDSVALLKHEQTHFDITELYARKIRKLLTEYPKPSGKEKEIRSIIDSLKQAERDENNLYDIQSVHSTNKVMQKKWEEKVKKELEETMAYINPKEKRTF